MFCHDDPRFVRLRPTARYVEVFTYDNSFKLFRYDRTQKNMFVNVYGISVSIPYYYGNDISVTEDHYQSGEGGLMRFNTSFGLNVIWDGEKNVGISISPLYATHICGLCGNADSKFMFL